MRVGLFGGFNFFWFRNYFEAKTYCGKFLNINCVLIENRNKLMKKIKKQKINSFKKNTIFA